MECHATFFRLFLYLRRTVAGVTLYKARVRSRLRSEFKTLVRGLGKIALILDYVVLLALHGVVYPCSLQLKPIC